MVPIANSRWPAVMVWRGPEGEQKAEVDRMPDPLVEERRPEHRWRQRLAPQPRIDLAQTKQLEMVDQEGAEQHERPAEPGKSPRDGTMPTGIGSPSTPAVASAATARTAAPAPGSRAAHRSSARPACGTNRVHQCLKPGRAITLCWMAKMPSSSKSMSSAGIERSGIAAVDGFRHRQVADEGDGIKKSAQKQRIGDDAVQK